MSETRPHVRLRDPNRLRRELRYRYPNELATERGYARILDVSPATWARVQTGELGIGGKFVASVMLALPGTRFERWFVVDGELPSSTGQVTKQA
jgi:hypothetical protein